MQHQNQEEDWGFYDLFVPLTNKKIFVYLAIIGFIVFFNMLFNGFVWDDLTYIVRNINMQSVDLAYSFSPNMFNSSGQYRPIPALYFSILYSSFGNNPFLFHLIQLLLHVACTSIIFLVFHKFFSKGLAFFLSAVFLVHPMNVESVSYFAQTVSPLNFLFGILAFYLSMKEKLSNKRFVLILLLLLVALLTKETGVLFIILILVYRLLFLKTNILKLFVGSVVTFSIYAAIRMLVGEVYLTIRYLVPIASASVYERLLTFPMIMFYYIKTFFFPVTLTIDQIWVIRSPEFSTVIFPLIADIAFIVIGILFGIYMWKHNRNIFKGYAFFSIWYLVGFLFISQIFPLDATVADRWFYFPMVGLLGILGFIYQSVSQGTKVKASVVILIAVTIVSLLSVRTMVRNSNWHSVFTLYHHDSRVYENFHIENNLGFEYGNIGDYENAIKHHKKSVELRPYEGNLRNLGLAYMTIGDDQNAKKYLEQAYQFDSQQVYAPHNHDELTYQSLAAYKLLHEDPIQTNAFLEIALADYPSEPSFWILYTLNKTRYGNKQEALLVAKKARETLPNNRSIENLYKKILNEQPYSFYYAGKDYRFNE